MEPDAADQPPESGRWPEDPGAALEAMLSAHGTAVLRFAAFYLRDRSLAEDAAQEVFLRAYRNWADFRATGSVKAWLMRITANVCRDELRRRRWRREESLEQFPAVNPEPGGDPEEAAIARLEGAALLGHVLDLPEEIRETVFLYYYFDLSTVDIAQTLDCPEGTVRSRLVRGRRRLKEVLEREGWSRGRS